MAGRNRSGRIEPISERTDHVGPPPTDRRADEPNWGTEIETNLTPTDQSPRS